MERSGGDPTEPEVPLGDASIATEIARAAARGRGADRSPTLEQLLAAFGERQPTEAARRRVAAALRVSGMGVRPSVLDAEPGQRVLLLPPGAPGPSRGRALGGLVVLAVVLLLAVGAAALLGSGNDDQRASDDLPPGGTTALTTSPTTTQATTAATDPTTTATQTTSTTADDDAAQAQADAEQRRRDRAARARREEAAARRRREAAAARLVTVRVVAPSDRPTFLCVDDGAGHELFNGTLSGAHVFKERRVRLNIGLASTTVSVNGTPVPLDGSPTGLDITRDRGARTLPLGDRPCA